MNIFLTTNRINIVPSFFALLIFCSVLSLETIKPTTFDDLTNIETDKLESLWVSLEDNFYETVKQGVFDGSYHGSLIFVKKTEASLDEHNNFLYTLVEWLEKQDNQQAVNLLVHINKIYYQAIHSFLCSINNHNSKVTKALGIFHSLAKYKRPDTNHYYFRTLFTKCILALESIDNIHNRYAEKKVAAYQVLEKCKKSALKIYHDLSPKEQELLIVSKKDICTLIQVLELCALRPPLAQSKTFHYVAGGVVAAAVVYLAVKYVPWEDIGHWVRDRMIYPAIDGVAAHVRDNFVYSDPARRIVHPSFQDMVNSMMYIQVPAPTADDPQATRRVINPAFSEALESMLYVQVPAPTDDDPHATRRELNPHLSAALAEMSQNMSRGMLRGLAPEGMQNPSVDLLTRHISHQLARGIITGIDPDAEEDASANDVINNLAVRLRQRLTEPQGEHNRTLAQEMVNQALRGLAPEGMQNPTVDLLTEHISRRLARGIITGIDPQAAQDASANDVVDRLAVRLRQRLTEPQGQHGQPLTEDLVNQIVRGVTQGLAPAQFLTPEQLENLTFEQVMNFYIQSLRAGIRSEADYARQQVAGYIRSFPGGSLIAGSSQPSSTPSAATTTTQPSAATVTPPATPPAPASASAVVSTPSVLVTSTVTTAQASREQESRSRVLRYTPRTSSPLPLPASSPATRQVVPTPTPTPAPDNSQLQEGQAQDQRSWYNPLNWFPIDDIDG